METEFPSVDGMFPKEIIELRDQVEKVAIFLNLIVKAHKARCFGQIQDAILFEKMADNCRGSLPPWAKQD